MRDDAPERVDGEQLLGLNVMVGHYEDGEMEIRTWATHATMPETAGDDERLMALIEEEAL